MIEDMMALGLPPGFYANGTKYQAKGRWTAGNLVRFSEGTIQPIGGWTPVLLSGASMVGTPLASLSWQLADGTPFLAVGTTDGLYVIDANNVVFDVTPTTIQASPFDWQLSTFGAYLIAVNTLLGDADLTLVNTFVWTGDTSTPAAPAWTDAVGPRGGYSAFVTPERFAVVLRGEDPTTAPARTGVDAAYSERRVYWASQEDLAGFVSTDVNTGGNFDVQTDGRLVVGAASRGQSLLWTDTDLWTMTYIGGDLIYSFANVGRQCGIVSRRGYAVLDKGAFWMGRDKFYTFDGFARSLPCDVTDAVFGNFNEQRAHTVFAIVNARFNEITWYFPAAGEQYPTRYVTYNHVENHWVTGTLSRSAGVPTRFTRDVIDAPVPVLFDGTTMFEHEHGQERTALAFLESGPVELGDGDRLVRVQGVLPDDKSVGDVQLRLYAAMSPDSAERLLGPFSLSAFTPIRCTARQYRVRLEEVTASAWRVGTVRFATRAVERRGAKPGIVSDSTPASIEIVPTTLTLLDAQHFTFESIVRNAAGDVLGALPDTWTSDNESEVTVNSDGTVTVLTAPGSANIQAHITTPALSSNIAAVTIASRPPAEIEVTPTTASVQQGNTQQMTAVVKDAAGVVLTDAPAVTWHSADVSKATVDATGLVTAVDNFGTVAITATLADPALTSNTATLTLTPIPLVATGGTITDLNGVRTHTFTASGTFSVISGTATAEEILVGAGGGGDNGEGGEGGGGGGVLQTTRPISVGDYAVVVGAGSASTVTGNSVTHTAGAGASGLLGGTSGAPQSNPGGAGPIVGGSAHGGGGGGAGAAGGDGSTDPVTGHGAAGSGGNGLHVTALDGAGFDFGGGGGGSTDVSGDPFGSGGTGGGGAGGSSGTSGDANTGGGGGGANGSNAGGNGASGVVRISYRYIP